MASNIPLLMISHGESLEKHSIYDMSEKLLRKLDIPTLRGKKVLGSSYGWLILVEPIDSEDDYDSNCCLFNPTTNDIIELPNLIDWIDYNQCILTKPPTEPDCYVFFSGLEQSFCRIGDKEYVTRTEEQQYEEEQENGCLGYEHLFAIGSFQGQIYGYMDPDKFVAIHIVGNTIEFSQIPMAEHWVIPYSSEDGFIYDIWLIESAQSDGEPLIVQKVVNVDDDREELVDFKVFRFDINEMECTELNNIGNQTIFATEDGFGYCCSSIGTKPNSIYYTNKDDNNLYIFDLEDRSTSSILQFDDDVAANKPIMTCWIENQIF
ncbi:hypothetical protein ABFS82_04G080300 [Erythranthe guttata]